jgi:transposase
MEKIVGIDVSKDWLDAHALPSGRAERFANDHAGLDALIAWLKPLGADVVALEATGGLEGLCVAALAAADMAVIVVNPAQVRSYAAALGKRAKTDQIDAAVIAAFVGRSRMPRPAPSPSSSPVGARSCR